VEAGKDEQRLIAVEILFRDTASVSLHGIAFDDSR
jgi:hypothetical protein